MWIPSDTEEIEQAIARGDLQETASFEAKRELPSEQKHNPFLATDVAAMSTYGGVFLVGVGEDADKRLTVRNPIALAGARERISSIIATSIAEVPYVDVRSYPTTDDPTLGYVVIVVPASPRAPHQVTVGEDLRFYARGPTGNRRMTEGEIARLYERRQQQQVDLDTRLAEVMSTAPYGSDDPDAGFVHAFVQPIPLDQALWDRAVEGAGGEQALQERMGHAARSITTRVEFDPSFRGITYWFRVGADAWRMSSQPEDPPNVELVEYLSDITVNIDGRAVLFAGNAAQRIHETVQGTDEGRKVIFERTIGGNTAALFAATRELFAAASHFGPVAVGVAATNLSGGASVGWAEGRNGPFISHQQPLFTASNYTRTARLSAATELDNPTALAQRMLGRLFTACTEIDGYSPFV